jgi:OOP family OmpA-OmpF porin
MAQKSWWRLPYVGLALVAAVAWAAGSTYWYVCKTQELCRTDDGLTQQATASTIRINGTGSQPATPSQTATLPPTQKVYFMPDSTEQTDQVDLGPIVTYAKAHTDSTITVAGYYADVIGSDDVGDLSTLRAEAVKQQLVDLGVPEAQIQVQAKGVDTTATGDDETVVANGRRVEITVK